MTIATLITCAAISGAATLALMAVSRVWRRHDAALWHALFVAVGIASLVFALGPAHLPAVVSPHIAASVVSMLGSGIDSNWMIVCVWAYLAGVAWQLMRLALGVALIHRLRRSTYLPGVAWVRHFSDMAPEVSTPCRLHRRVQVPMTTGWLDPMIILPESALEWPAERLRAILLHEHAHSVRRDYLWNLCVAVHQAVYWFSPAAWLLARRVRLLAEFASDRDASEKLGRRPYALQLVDAASAFSAHSRSGMFAPGGATAIVRRIHALASSDTDAPAMTLRRRLALASVVAFVLAVAMSVRVDAVPAVVDGPARSAPAFPHVGQGSHDAKHAALHHAAGH